MAVGRSFAESLQKALRSMETGLTGLNEIAIPGAEPGAPFDRRRLGTAGELQGIARAERVNGQELMHAGNHLGPKLDHRERSQISAESRHRGRVRGVGQIALATAACQGGRNLSLRQPAHVDSPVTRDQPVDLA